MSIAYEWRSMAEAPQNESVIVYASPSPDLACMIVGEAYHRVDSDGEDEGWWWANTAPGDFDPSDQIYPLAWTPLPGAPRLEVVSAAMRALG